MHAVRQTDERASRHPYYGQRLEALRDLFGTQDVEVGPDHLRVGGASFPIVEDVIVLLAWSRCPPRVQARLPQEPSIPGATPTPIAEDIQFTFGEEWKEFADILAEHQAEFEAYFDLVDLDGLSGARVADLGCGAGRWSRFLAPHCGEIVLVDFSEAIFVARENLRDVDHAMYFLGDVTDLPFRDDAFAFAFSLGVLHHLPSPALNEVRRLARLSPRLLVYLYYALDNRPAHYRWLLAPVTGLRHRVSRVRGERFRSYFSWLVTLLVYAPLVGLGRLLSLVRLGRHIPLYEGYRGKSLRRMRQDAYDRFFTRIEQRVRKEDILALSDTFRKVTVSDDLPYWHFVAER